MIVNKKSIYTSITVFDFLLINLSFFLASAISQPTEAVFERSHMIILLLILNLTWIFYTRSSGFFEDFLTRPFPIHFFNILKLSLLITFVGVFYLFLVREDLYTRNFILLIGLLILTTISLRTLLFKGVFKFLRYKGKSIRNLLIIGAGGIGKKFKEIVTGNSEYGYNFIGFVGSDSDKSTVGTIENLDNIINKYGVQEVVIALPNNPIENLEEIVRICNKNAVGVHIIPDYFKFLSTRFQLSTVSNIPVITIRDEPLNEAIRRFLKRSFDIFFSVIVLVFVLSWFIPIVTILIKLESSGPAIFIQERFGVKNKKFRCFKFRTLAYEPNTLQQFKPIFKGDSRITKVGKILRKTNLDELPQFINVLKGEMSVVGPRPHAVNFDLEYAKIFEDIKMRYKVRPGITGWAQINGMRGDIENEEENKKRTLQRMKYDLWYIENWSLKLDFQIILLTMWHMVKGDTKGI